MDSGVGINAQPVRVLFGTYLGFNFRDKIVTVKVAVIKDFQVPLLFGMNALSGTLVDIGTSTWRIGKQTIPVARRKQYELAYQQIKTHGRHSSYFLLARYPQEAHNSTDTPVIDKSV